MDIFNKIKKLYSLSKDENHGYNEDIIIELEKRLNIKLPKTLKDYYLQLGKNWDINEIDFILHRLDGTYNIHDMYTYPYISSSAPEWKPVYGPETTNDEEYNRKLQELHHSITNHHITNAWDSSYFVFCDDVERAFSWGIKLSELKKDNPIVSAICNYPGYTGDTEWYNWNEIYELDKFLLEMAYRNGTFGGLRYYAISDRHKSPIDNDTVKIIEKNWMEIKELSNNILTQGKYFTNDNTEIIMLTPDQLYYGTSDQEKMSNILKTINTIWLECRSD
jgi:hypothetical protein